MSINKLNNIVLSGKDWCNEMREIDIDPHLWQKVCHWHGGESQALNWVQLQIKLFSSRHTQRPGLSQIISAIAFVEMAKPDHRQLRTSRNKLLPTAKLENRQHSSNLSTGTNGG